MSTMIRKWVALGLSLCLAASLVACGGGSGASSSGTAPESTGTSAGTQDSSTTPAPEGGERSITFTVNKYGSDPANQERLLDEICDQFYEESGIKVTWNIVDWDQSLTKMTLASTGGETPDVYDIYFTASLLAMGNGEYGPDEIDDVIEELGADQYAEAGWVESYQQDHWYGLPWRTDTRILMYNKDHFAEAGIENPPTTWDEMLECAEKLTQRNADGNIERAGLLWNVGNGRFDQTWKCLLEGVGGTILNEDNTAAAFNSPAGEESLKMMRDVIDVYNVTPATCIDPSFDPVAEFMAGKASMVLGVGAGTKKNIETMAPQMLDSVAGAVIPSKDGSGNSSVASAASFALMKGSKDPEAGKEFLKFLGSKEIMTKWATGIDMLNCSSEVMADPYFSEDAWLSVFAAQLNRAGPMDQPVASFSQMDAWPNGPLPKLVTDVMAGVEIPTALAEAEAGVNELLAG